MSAVRRAVLLLRREVALWELLADLERRMNEADAAVAANPGDELLRQEALLLMARIANERRDRPEHRNVRAAMRLRADMRRLLPALEHELRGDA